MRYQINEEMHYLFEANTLLLDIATNVPWTPAVMEWERSLLTSSQQALQKKLDPIEQLRGVVAQAVEPYPELLEKYAKRLDKSRRYSLLQYLFPPIYGADMEQVLAYYQRLSPTERQQIVRTELLDGFLPEGESQQGASDEQLAGLVLRSGYSDESKVKILTILTDTDTAIRESAPLLETAIGAIKENEHLLEEAKQDIFASLQGKLNRAEALLEDYIRFPQVDELAQVFPVLLSPSTSGVFRWYHVINDEEAWWIFYGSYFDQLSTQQALEENQAHLVENTLKMLGDKTKQDILRALQEKPMYGQELAEQTGLTTATISYHMSLLLANGLVSAERDSVRLYYSLNRKKLHDSLLDTMRFFDVLAVEEDLQ